jgi:zinc protease
MNSIVELVRFGLPDDFHDTYSARVRALTEQDMRTAAERLLMPENLVWVVVGDRAKIESGIRELNYGEIRVVDVNGDPVR